MDGQKIGKRISRRGFLTSAAGVGTSLAIGRKTLAQIAKPGGDYVSVGLIGAGRQGQALLETCLKMPAIRIMAVCDIWANYNLRRASDMLNEHRHAHGTYVDYRQMLDEESALDAVIVATPDFCHAEQTTACLKAGLHVYCEAPMSNRLEEARKMVRAAKETGKLLQIGHQRRSNPKYRHCGENLLRDVKLLGRIAAVNGQWNRPVQPDRGWPRRAPIDEATLKKHGYESMQQFRNWQWYKNLGGGPLAALASHQVDVFNWFLDALPGSVLASGGTDYYSKKTRECYDTVMAIYEYETRRGTVRAFYQTINSNSNMGSFEAFMGDQGTLRMSESGQCRVYREDSAPEWRRWVRMGFLLEPKEKEESDTESVLDVTDTVEPPSYRLPIKFDEPNPKPHLENFLSAIRGEEKLNCPGETGYEAIVTVLKINDAIETSQKLRFKLDEFTV